MENDRTASYDMRTYIGTKTVQAKRMNAADAKRAGANVPGKYFEVGHPEYNPGADGYLVIYDGGYRSWSPERVFEDAYKVADSVEALARIECRELGQRIQKEMSKLYEPYTPITDHQRELLLLQVEAMRSYYDILRTRLAEMEKASNERQRLAAINSKSE
ncbi:hypothetical protein [uncultured Muribaculum sp.]|uniref:crAss001_48 related protein n=1 Tax=uncultured Muribaculum sp. TaxID=1918613 RepID=UPI00259D12C8|nr:hypothetical protein [uncultured Muribaculum sp.]